MKTTGFGIVGGAWHAKVYHHLPQAELVAVMDDQPALAVSPLGFKRE